MTDPENVFAAFVAANPVTGDHPVDDRCPDVDELLDAADRQRVAGRRSPADWQRAVWAAAAAITLIVDAGGLILATRDASRLQVATSPSPEELLIREAAVTAEEWLAAVNAGDIDRVMALSSPTKQTEADRRVHEWLAGLAAAGMPVEVRSCEATPVDEAGARVDCAVTLGDRVAVELGVADVVAPFDYRDGLVSWQPYAGADISVVNEAYSAYLRTFRPAEYDAACSPAAYAAGTVIQDRGLALTGDCARLAAPLADVVVAWIRDGRPEGP